MVSPRNVPKVEIFFLQSDKVHALEFSKAGIASRKLSNFVVMHRRQHNG